MSKVAIITGASRGIGRSIGIQLANLKYAVVVNYLSSASAADALVNEITQGGGIAKAVQADVSTAEGRYCLLETTLSDFNSIDLLVNNAGITRDNLMIRMSKTQWNEVIDTNFAAVVELCELTIPHMMKLHAGKIINISSTVGVHGNAGQANYATAKAALISYTRIKARELMPYIQINAIAPGIVRTDMTARFELDKLANTKLRRPATPEDIAACAGWLASTGGDYVTGQIIEIDGGLFLWSDVQNIAS